MQLHMNPQTPIHVLIVDDDEADIVLTRKALQSSVYNLDVAVCHDGEQTLRYLHRLSPYENAIRPHLILLDLNMPKMDGRETLDRIKQNLELKKIPVIVFTTSDNAADISKCYVAGCNCYISKPTEFGDFGKVIRKIEEFWFSIVNLVPAKE